MSYRIRYPVLRKIRRGESQRHGLPGLTALSFLFFLLLVRFFWPEGMAWIRETVSLTGLDQAASGLCHGESVAASISGIFSLFGT